MNDNTRGADFAGTMDVITSLQRRMDKMEISIDKQIDEITEIAKTSTRLDERFIHIQKVLEKQNEESSSIKTGIIVSAISGLIAAMMTIFIAGVKVSNQPPAPQIQVGTTGGQR